MCSWCPPTLDNSGLSELLRLSMYDYLFRISQALSRTDISDIQGMVLHYSSSLPSRTVLELSAAAFLGANRSSQELRLLFSLPRLSQPELIPNLVLVSARREEASHFHFNLLKEALKWKIMVWTVATVRANVSSTTNLAIRRSPMSLCSRAVSTKMLALGAKIGY